MTTPHTTRVFIVAVVAALLLAPAGAAGVAFAQDDGASATPTATPVNTPVEANNSASEPGGGSDQSTTTDDESLTLEELRRGGRSLGEEAPDGARGLRNGAVAITYVPASPFQNGDTFLSPGTTLNTITITVYSTRFGANTEPRDVVLNVAYFQTGEQQTTGPNGATTTETVAKNVSVQEVEVTLGTGYSTSEVSLVPHYEQEVQMAMWLSEPDGSEIDGARWANLQQRSDPAAQPAGIANKGDLWRYVAINVFLVGVVGLLAGFGAGKHVLNRIIRGPDLGVGTYGIAVVVGGFVVGAFAYMYASTVLSNIPMIWGALIALVGFVGYVEVGGPTSRSFLFEQDVLTDAKSPSAKDVKDSVYQRIHSVKGVEREDGSIGLPADGLRPAIARYFAEPATLSELDLSTHIDAEGHFDRKFIADPESDEVLVHKPAHLTWNPTLIHPAQGEPPSGLGAIADLVDRVNWPFVLGSVGFLGGGWIAASMLLSLPYLGLAVGAVGVWALGTEARDGHATFEPAPIHFRSAKATVQNLAVEYDDAKTIEEAERERWKAEATTAAEVRDREARRDKTVSQKIAEETAGVSFDESQDGNVPMPEDERDHRGDDGRGDGRQQAHANGAGAASTGEEPDEDDEEGWRDA